MPLSKQDAQAFVKELGGLSVDELNARNEELEASKQAIKERQHLLVGVRATAIRADRMKEADASIERAGMRPAAQRRTANVASASSAAVR